MNLTTNDLLIVIGEQTLEIKMLRLTVEAQEKRLKELEPPKPGFEHPSRGPNALLKSIEGGADGTS